MYATPESIGHHGLTDVCRVVFIFEQHALIALVSLASLVQIVSINSWPIPNAWVHISTVLGTYAHLSASRLTIVHLDATFSLWCSQQRSLGRTPTEASLDATNLEQWRSAAAG